MIRRTLWDGLPRLPQSGANHYRGLETRPAYSSACKLCHWYSACVERLKATDDLTLIPELGRSKRDAMLTLLETVKEFADPIPTLSSMARRQFFEGIGPDTLAKFHVRAKLLSTKDAKPILRAPVQLPGYDRELFFDIEVDPMRDICYLHGFVERQRPRQRDREIRRVLCRRMHAGIRESGLRRCVGVHARQPPLRHLLLFKIRADDLSQAATKVSRTSAAPRRSKSCSIRRTRSISITTW